jgi:hypothetical protein
MIDKFICSLFNDALCYLNYTTSNDWMIVNDELEKDGRQK